jgi:dCTP deaminase
MQCSFLPAGQPVLDRLKDLTVGKPISLKRGAVLTKGQPYLIPLKERLALTPYLRAKANPKSSTGRADVFTRVITDFSDRFDEIGAGYHGELYLEVVPLSYSVKVREDLTLNQVRLSAGRCSLSEGDVRSFHASESLLLRRDTAVPTDDLRLTAAGGMFLGLDLVGDAKGRVGYKAASHPPPLDLTQRRKADPSKYWVHVERGEHPRIILDPHAFYLLMSFEAVVIPPTLAAEMTAYDPTSGELRTHYAGFFDPGFGYDEDNRFRGSTAALEVRAHDVPFMIEHRQPVCTLTFEWMLEAPEVLYGGGVKSNYQQQTDTLGKHFGAWGSDNPGRRQSRRKPGDGQLDLPV